MGNKLSSTKQVAIVEEPIVECLICYDAMLKCNDVKCIRCDISIHSKCEKMYRNERGYSRCPHCQRIGTLFYTHVTNGTK